MTGAAPDRRNGGDRRTNTRRARFGHLWERWGRDLVTTVAVGLAAYAVIGAAGAASDARDGLHKLDRESAARIDQTCAISEAKQRSDSDALIRTYQYLGSLSARQFAQPINKAILANLPVTIRAAQIDDAPPFCDQPGVGLPEPDPPTPCPPKGTKPKRCISPPANLPPSGS